ncbi:MAG: cytochrome C oxidase assembly protein [Paracoccaceae bacterium]|nr:cytochrome C oxidase assembly protein [Paracoccaceae bacterium]
MGDVREIAEDRVSSREIHQRRKRSNAMIGLMLGGFVVLVFAISVVKMMNGASMEAYDHVLRPSLLERAE